VVTPETINIGPDAGPVQVEGAISPERLT